MHVSLFSVFSILVLLSGTPVEDRFDLIVEVKSAAGIKLPADVWVSVDGVHTGYHSTILLPGRTARFSGLASGSYRITVEAEGYQPSRVELPIRTSLGDEYVTADLGPPISDDKDRTDPAVVHYEALRLSPQAQTHWDEAGKALAETRLDSALKNLEQVTQLEPQFAMAHSAIGTVSLKLRKWNQAERSFWKATELEPGDYRYQVGLGWFYLQADRPAEALAPLQKAVELHPENAENHAFLGEALRVTGNTEQSIIHLEKAVAFDPTLGLALHSLALAYLDMGEPQLALQSFQTLLKTKNLPETEMEEVIKLVSELEKNME